MIERSENYGYYSDLLWCAVPLTGMAWYYYGLRPVLLMLTALVTAYLCDCALAPLHGEGYRAHEPSSECFAALIVLLMPASVSYGIVIVAVIAAVLAKGGLLAERALSLPPSGGGPLSPVSPAWRRSLLPGPRTQLPIWGEINDNLVQGMNESPRSGGLPSASTMNSLRQRVRRYWYGRGAGHSGLRSVFAGTRPGPPLGAHPVYDRRYRHSLAVPAPERTACLQLAVGSSSASASILKSTRCCPARHCSVPFPDL